MISFIKRMPLICKLVVVLALIEYTRLIDLFSVGGNYLRLLLFVVFFILFSQNNNRIRPNLEAYRIFILWTFFVIIRGSLIGNTPPESDSLMSVVTYTLSFPHSVIALLFPMVAMIQFDKSSLYYLKYLSIFFSLLFFYHIYVHRLDIWGPNAAIGMTMIQDVNSEAYGGWMTIRRLVSQLYIGGGLIIFMSYCISYIKKNIYISLVPLALIALFAVSAGGGGRGTTLLYLGYIVTMFYLLYSNNVDNNLSARFFKRFIVIGLIVIVAYGLKYLYSTGALDFFLGRLFENGEVGGDLAESTRENYTKDMILDFDSTPWSWIIGRGINGEYISGESTRQYIEWGYMWMILKGGVIWLALYVYLLFKGFVVGFFRSNNLLSKAIGFLCLWQVLSLIPFGLPAITVHYFLVWHLWAALLFTDLPYCSDAELMPYFNRKFTLER